MPHLEHERKFLIRRRPPGLSRCPRERIEQGYLAVGSRGGQDQEIRIRRTRQESVLTVKRGRGRTRQEIEVNLPAAAARELWPLTRGLRIVKTRYRVPHAGGGIEVDVYAGRLRGLMVAEVERESRSALRRFVAPSWLGREITGDRRYSNAWMAARGAGGSGG